MVLMDQSGYAKIKAREHTMLLVSTQTKKNQPNGPLSAPFWNVNSKRVEVDLLQSQVGNSQVGNHFGYSGQTKTRKTSSSQGKVRCGKDIRRIGICQKVSAGEGKKEQQWQEKDL